MGITTMGVPRDIVLQLARICGSDTFVETGTYKGETTKWAAKHFGSVHTIERADVIFKEYSPELSKIPAITTHFGDSKTVLPQIVEKLGDLPAVHWLDGHWSGGPTAGEEDQCPIMAELECLVGRPNDLILIDDARLFLCTPQPPHQPAQWPTIGEIINLLPSGDQQPFIQVVDDVIFIIPNKPDLRAAMIKYSQKKSQQFWEEFTRLQKGPLSGLKKVIGGIKNQVTGN